MLPLWIIDLCDESERSQKIRSLVGRLRGVMFDDASQAFMRLGESELEAREKDGNGPYMWYFTHLDDPFTEVDRQDKEAMAQALYEFQEELVAEGQRFVSILRRSGIRQDRTLNVCVLADSVEDTSQMLFPSIAAMVQKEKGRIVPTHVHQGLAITGFFHVPTDLCSQKVGVRQKVLQTLREIEIQHIVSSVRGYDRMMLWQDIQNRTESHFRLMGPEGQAEYVAQCLTHLYYACDDLHPLISGSSAADKFYFTMGATALFFDASVQDELDRIHVGNGILQALKEEGDQEAKDDITTLVPEEDISAERMLSNFAEVDVDLSDVDVPTPRPHPISDFMDRDLKRYYFHHELRLYPANLKQRIMQAIDKSCKSTLEGINASGNKMLRNFQEVTMPAAIRKQIVTATPDTGGLQRIVRNVGSLKEKLAVMKSSLSTTMEDAVWRPLRTDYVPKGLRDDFDEYHDAYTRDCERNESTDKGQCAEMKRNAMNALVSNLRMEPTLASRIVRAVLLGIACVMAIMPMLDALSPTFIDLGNIKRSADIWATGIFLIPAVVELIRTWLYYRKRGQRVRKLKACYLHDAYARIAGRLEGEATHFYEKAMDICDEYVTRCQNIMADVQPYDDSQAKDRLEVPQSRFCQPVVGGVFGGVRLMEPEETEDMEIMVNRQRREVRSLDKTDYFSLIRGFADQMCMLFRNVKPAEIRPRKFDQEQGHEVFASIAEAREAREREWATSVGEFRPALMAAISREMLPREVNTVGEMVVQHAVRRDHRDVLRPLIEAAATNGEFTTTADNELADVKVGYVRAADLATPYLPINKTMSQIDETSELYAHYLFLSRWRTFDQVSLNRILPQEDFDETIRQRLVGDDDDTPRDNPESAIILWAVCRGDNSTDWLRLFDGANLGVAFEQRETYVRRMMHED